MNMPSPSYSDHHISWLFLMAILDENNQDNRIVPMVVEDVVKQFGIYLMPTISRSGINPDENHIEEHFTIVIHILENYPQCWVIVDQFVRHLSYHGPIHHRFSDWLESTQTTREEYKNRYEEYRSLCDGDYFPE